MQSEPQKCKWPLAEPFACRKPDYPADTTQDCFRLLNEIGWAFTQNLVEQFARTFQVAHFFVGLGQVKLGVDLLPLLIMCRRQLSIGVSLVQPGFQPAPVALARQPGRD